MTSSEPTDLTVIPHDEPTTSPEVQPPSESVTAEPKPTLAADTPTISASAAAAPASSPPSNINMTTIQDPDAPSLPGRPTVQETAPAPTIDPNQPPQDPQVASLQAIFPDFDVAVLQSVLESVGGNQDLAVDMLLGMSDPNYVPQAPPVPVQIQSQTDLDEEFARRLLLEEQQQQGWQPQAQGQQAPYQPRIRGRQLQQQSDVDPQGDQRDSMGDIQEQFAKIADTGKKTFSSLFSKVKAKVQEFDQQRTGQSSTQAGTEPSWGSESTGGPPGSQSYYESQQAHAQPSQPSYYDPIPQRHESGAARTHTPGYDVTWYDEPQQNPESRTNPTPAVAVPAPLAKSGPDVGGSSSPPHTGTPPPPSTTSGAPAIDPGKLGMLPKRPVSLLRSPSDPAPKPDDEDDDDDDELEYAENPFEEHK